MSGPRYDIAILLIVGLLMTLGAVMVFSASVTVEGASLNLRNWAHTPLKQLAFVLLGFFTMIVVANIDYRVWQWERPGEGRWAIGLYVLLLVLLIAVLVPGIGTEWMGARRTIVLTRSPMLISFQPAEFAKIALLIWLAAALARPRLDLRRFRVGFLPVFLAAIIPVGLIAKEDFGTAALLGVMVMLMHFLAGARWLHLAGVGLLGLAGAAYAILTRPHRVQRIITFFTENPDPQAEGYQITQSLIAIGSGGWFGRGLGAGVQKYGYLPQDNNDFIFSILCEELGIVGGLIVIALFLLLLGRGLHITRTCQNPFGRLLAAGITLLICLQAAFNIGVVTNSVPTKGISLPFVSAGGSGVLFLGIAAGVLASIGARRKEAHSVR